MGIGDILVILRHCKFDYWRFVVNVENGRMYLQVQFDAPCNVAGGTSELQCGRKWFLSPHMTKSEIVQTAFKAVITAVEHEVREQFTYRGAAIFGPHFDVEELVGMVQSRAYDVRST